MEARDLDGREENVIRRARSTRAELPFPDQMPPLIKVVPDMDGTLWVLGRTPNGPLLRKLHRDGRLAAEYGPPEGFDPFVARDDLLFGVLTDSLGVDFLAIYMTQGEDHVTIRRWPDGSTTTSAQASP
jgi:hypothetical protein